MKWLIFPLIVLLSACAKPIDESKLRIVEVKLLSAEEGYRSETVIEIFDMDRKMSFKKSIYCKDWDRDTALKRQVGNTFKVYDLSTSLVPNYYKLGERFC